MLLCKNQHIFKARIDWPYLELTSKARHVRCISDKVQQDGHFCDRVMHMTLWNNLSDAVILL